MNKICISKPDDDYLTPLTPETIERTPEEKPNKNQLTPTITEENELDDQSLNNKSSLSLPVEPPPTGPVERDRRKLSVQGQLIFVPLQSVYHLCFRFHFNRKNSFSNTIFSINFFRLIDAFCGLWPIHFQA